MVGGEGATLLLPTISIIRLESTAYECRNALSAITETFRLTFYVATLPTLPILPGTHSRQTIPGQHQNAGHGMPPSRADLGSGNSGMAWTPSNAL
jgi:hypothetical protein